MGNVLVKDWLADFLERHRMRFNPHDWPEADTEDYREFFRVWLRTLLDMKPRPSEDEAEAASERLGTSPPRWRNEHLPRLIAEIEAVRRMGALSTAGIPAERSDAEALSRHCPHCSGSGFATIYHPRYDGSPEVEVVKADGEVVMRAARMAAHCTCPMGRWMRARTDRDMLRRVPCLEKTLANTEWTTEDPSNTLDRPARPRDWRRAAGEIGRAASEQPRRIAREFPEHVRSDPVIAAELAARERAARGQVPGRPADVPDAGEAAEIRAAF